VFLIAKICPYSLEINVSSSGKETVENRKTSCRQLAPCQEKRIKRQQTVSSAGCKVLAPNSGFLLASMPSHCRFKPIECSYSESVSVSVPQDKFWGSAISGYDAARDLVGGLDLHPQRLDPHSYVAHNPERRVPHPVTHEPCLRRLVLWFAVLRLVTAADWCYTVADLPCFAVWQCVLPGSLAPSALSDLMLRVVCRFFSIRSTT